MKSRNLVISVLVIILIIVAYFLTGGKYKPDKNTFEISGNIKNTEQGQYLYLRDINNRVIDSINISAGKFEYEGYIYAPQHYRFYLNQFMIGSFFAAPGDKIIISFDAQNAKNRETKDLVVKGGEIQTIYENYYAGLLPILEQEKKNHEAWMEFRKEGNVNDPVARAPFDSLYKQNHRKKLNYNKNYARENQNYVSLYLLLSYLRFSFDVNELENIIEKYSEPYVNSDYYKAIMEKIAIKKNVQIGQIAPDFTKPDVNGNMISLSSFRGKYLLLDFWASWCGPCRKENPWVLKAYNKYKDKGFYVLGVSYDFPGQKKAWLKAIKDDKLPWTQVSSLQGWADTTSKLYDISGIPAPFLLDPEGRIIAKHDEIREEKLMKKLEEIFSEKAD